MDSYRPAKELDGQQSFRAGRALLNKKSTQWHAGCFFRALEKHSVVEHQILIILVFFMYLSVRALRRAMSVDPWQDVEARGQDFLKRLMAKCCVPRIVRALREWSRIAKIRHGA